MRSLPTRIVPDTPEMIFFSLYARTGTLILLAESPAKYWWSSYFLPNVHYISIRVIVLLV